MKTKKRLNRRLLAYLGACSAIFIVLYSLVISSFFMYGIALTNEIILANEARSFAELYKKDTNAGKPERSFLKSYRKIENIPAPLVKLFPEEKREHGKMLIIDTSDFGFKSETLKIVRQLDWMCRNKECEIILFYSYQLDEEQWIYFAMGITPEVAEEEQLQFAFNMLVSIAGAFFVALMALAFALVRKISQPITELALWAQNLNVDNVRDDLPNLRFVELEIVANQLQEAFLRISTVLDNEQRFLNNASHELRTPVAVLATNLALLEKLRLNNKDNDAQDKVIERLIRAAENMKQLMQTILWLSKDTQDNFVAQQVSLDELIRQLKQENSYLLANKDVDVNTRLAAIDIDVPAALCSIVLTNLIRNAYQYTHQGEIEIELTEQYIRVTNRCVKDQKKSTLAAEEYGFGLGIELVKRASEKLAWRFESIDVSGGRRVTLYFIE